MIICIISDYSSLRNFTFAVSDTQTYITHNTEHIEKYFRLLKYSAAAKKYKSNEIIVEIQVQ